jgi:multidrug transporter EmrE-like cation transporter
MLSQKNAMLGILLLTIACIEAFGLYLLKVYYDVKYVNFNRTDHFQFLPQISLPYITWVCYGLCTFLLAKTYEYTSMGKSEVYWDALSAIIVPLVSTIAFKEQLGYQGWGGIFLVIIGALILSNTNSK